MTFLLLLHFIFIFFLLLINLLTSLFINLILGFIVPNIDVYGHIGGLVGGLLLSYIVGVYRKCKKKNTINGLIIITILIASLSYMLIIK